MNISYLASHIIRKQLNVLVVEKVASASIVSKLSQSGIGLAHLELALKRDSVNGIKLLLKEPNGAFKYRTTNNNMAIAKITSYIQKRRHQYKMISYCTDLKYYHVDVLYYQTHIGCVSERGCMVYV